MTNLFALVLLVTAMTVTGCGETKKAAPAAAPAAVEETKPAEGAAAPATEAPK